MESIYYYQLMKNKSKLYILTVAQPSNLNQPTEGKTTCTLTRSYQECIVYVKIGLHRPTRQLTLLSFTRVDVCVLGARRCFSCSYFKNVYVFGKPGIWKVKKPLIYNRYWPLLIKSATIKHNLVSFFGGWLVQSIFFLYCC